MTREKRYEIIKEVLDINDPMGLLALGCPTDEYSDEARLIEEKLDAAASERALNKIISDVFYSQFDEMPKKRLCRKISAEIISKLS